MASIYESAPAVGTGPSDQTGLYLVSLDQVIPFTQYTRYVLPLDGYVYWLKTQTTTIKGSLHVNINKRQNEDETISVNNVVFSTATPVQEFNNIAPDIMWVGTYDVENETAAPIRFAFTRLNVFKATTLNHYVGDAVYPALASQLVDVGEQLPLDTLVVSNSLPIWLTLKAYTPVWLTAPNPAVTLYPSFAVPANLQPPYGAVHIDPLRTENLQTAPQIGPVRPFGNAVLGTVNGTTPDSTHRQLATDTVRVTLYGLTNQQALDFQDLVLQFSYDQDTIGLMSIPTVRDEKRTQAELGILAMKKTIEFQVSYYQARANDAARQLIESASIALLPQDF